MDPALDIVLRAGLALLFLAAAAHKVRDPARFRATLADYRLLPGRLVPAGALLATGGEVAVVIGLCWLRPAGLLGAAMLLTVYGVAIAINLARGRRHIDCGCAGPAVRRPITGWLVARNAVLAVVALASLVPPGARSLEWVDAVTVTGALAALVALYAASDLLSARAPDVARLRGAA